MKFEIKDAGLDDLESLMEWRETVLRDVFSVDNETDMSTLMEENRRYYKKALTDGSHSAAFVYADGQIVGCGGLCCYSEMPSPDNLNGKCAYLMNIYTVPEYRRNGIAQELVTRFIKQAQDNGVSKIYLEASDGAVNMYRKLGFEDMNGYMKYAGRAEAEQ